MTTVEQRNSPLNQEETLLENNNIDSTNQNLSLPTLNNPTFDINNPTPLSPLASLASLERCISNPLVRGYSNVSVSSDNEGAHFVPFGRGHDDIANPNINTTPNAHPNPNSNMIDLTSFGFSPHMIGINSLFPHDNNDGPNPISPMDMPININVKSKVLQQHIHNNISILGPLEDVDTDATSSQVASSDLPSSQTDNDVDKTTFNINAEAAEFVPNIPVPPIANLDVNNIILPPVLPQLIGLQNVCLPPLLQAVPLINNINMNFMPVAVPGVNNMLHTPVPIPPVVLSVQGSNNNNQPQYDELVNNYMNATKNTDNNSPPQPQSQSRAQLPLQRRSGGKYVRVDKNKNKNKNNIQNMDITEIIKMNLSLPVLLQNNMICKFMKHQNGSRYIQEKLKLVSDELISQILSHIIFKQKQILSLSEDIFGNYVIQIFFENGTVQHHQLLINNLLHNNVYRLSRSFYGCRVIQKAFDTIPKNECINLIRELEHEDSENEKLKVINDNKCDKSVIHECIICPNANHVIQKIITLNLEMSHIQFIIACIDGDICFYSSHIFGCRIVQNIINHYGYNNNAKMLSEMVCLDNLLRLCQSQYGNYVIQHILALTFDGKSCVSIKKRVIKNVFSNVLYLSKNKYGSNVVEKCLQKANDKERDFLLDEIFNSPRKSHKNKCVLVEMVKHKYANYVIQKLLTFCNIKQQQRLIYQIDRNIPNLRGCNYGKHIMEKIKKIKQSLNQNQYNY